METKEKQMLRTRTDTDSTQIPRTTNVGGRLEFCWPVASWFALGYHWALT